MIEALIKLLPILTVAVGFAVSSPNVKAQIGKLMQTAKVLATQQDVSDIAKMVYLDSADGSGPTPEEFSAYLKNHMRTADPWNQPYRLRYDKIRKELVVSSAGPDLTFDTNDDIGGSYPLDRF